MILVDVEVDSDFDSVVDVDEDFDVKEPFLSNGFVQPHSIPTTIIDSNCSMEIIVTGDVLVDGSSFDNVCVCVCVCVVLCVTVKCVSSVLGFCCCCCSVLVLPQHLLWW